MAKRANIPPRIVDTTPTIGFVKLIDGGWDQYPTGLGMQPEASLKVPLAERQACRDCGHLHRMALLVSYRPKKCPCCLADSKGETLELADALSDGVEA